MTSTPATPTIALTEIDPSKYGVTVTPGLERLMQDIQAHVQRHLQARVETQLREQMDAEYEARYEAKLQEQLVARMQALFEQLVLSRRRQFGRSSEALSAQFRLFDEADALGAQTTEADELAPAGAHASALIYSLVQTAKANGREPYTWLRTVLRELPRASTVEDYEALLPWNLDLETLAVQAIDAASMRHASS